MPGRDSTTGPFEETMPAHQRSASSDLREHSLSAYTAVCLAGLSPPVVTETLYALARRLDPPIVPREVFVVTTGRAREVVRRALAGPRGAVARLRDEYDLP
jgi:hypothetical protein